MSDEFWIFALIFGVVGLEVLRDWLMARARNERERQRENR